MKALVTGCAGFVGSHVTEMLLGLGYRVLGVDSFRTGMQQFLDVVRLDQNFCFISSDIRDCDFDDTIFDGVDVIYHLAANADIRGGLSDTNVDLEQNVLVTHRLLELAREKKIERFIFASTAAVLGEPNVFPTPEDVAIPTQTSCYGASKMACECYVSAYANCFGIESYVFRFVSLLGPRYPHGHVIDFVKKLRTDPSTLNVLGDGTAQKSYLHISDCLSAIRLVCEDIRPARDLTIPYDVYHLGFDGYIRVSDSAQLISDAMNLSPDIVYEGQTRGWVGDNPFVHLATDKIRRLGWTPENSIEESIQDTVEWLLRNEWIFGEDAL